MDGKKRVIETAVLLFVSGAIGCVDAEPLPSDSEIEGGGENAEIEERVGFVTVPARRVTSPGLPETEIATAEIFYHLIPAEEEAAQKPVVVVFNGGPGAATSGFLQLIGTGPYTLDIDTWEMTENPYPLTELANLLYIDPRQTGFSFSRALPGTAPGHLPRVQLNATFNNYTDAADIILAILEVIHAQPPLHRADIVLMGESHGGIRAQYMFDLLLRPTQLLSPTVYRDDVLLSRLQAHFDSRFPETEFSALTPEVVTAQFGRQLLLQPSYLLPDSEGFCNLCRCTPDVGDLDCPPENCVSDIRKPRSWSSDYMRALPGFILDEAIFETVFGALPNRIELLSAENRDDAYRLDIVEAPPAWVEAQGVLGESDTYFVPLSVYAHTEYNDPIVTSYRTGDLFIRNGVWIDTFITRAYYDGLTNLDDLPSGMLYTTRSVHSTPLVREAYLDTEPREGVERPGWAYLTYTQAAGISEERRVEWRMPFYAEAGHTVTADQAADVYKDIADFLKDTGAIE